MNGVSLIGFGEVGAILADDLTGRGVEVTAWDILFGDRESAPSRNIAQRTARRAFGAADAVRDADLIISAVTAAQTVDAALSCGSLKGAWYLDINSASPSAKREAAAIVNAAGGRYVEAALMSPIQPKRLQSPFLLGGPYAVDAVVALRDFGFTGATDFSEIYGQAAAAKLCRSVVVKGLEALLLESLVTARHYRVDDVVLESFKDLFPHPNWRQLSYYMISRAIEHGRRRAQEMEAAAITVADAGLAPLMSGSCAGRQAEARKFASARDARDLDQLLDAIRSHLPNDIESFE